MAHSLHWYGFSPLRILKCPIRWIFFKKHCHTDCICMVFPQYEFTYASQKYTVWYDIHFENCVRVKWFATCHTRNEFLLWFIPIYSGRVKDTIVLTLGTDSLRSLDVSRYQDHAYGPYYHGDILILLSVCLFRHFSWKNG